MEGELGGFGEGANGDQYRYGGGDAGVRYPHAGGECLGEVSSVGDGDDDDGGGEEEESTDEGEEEGAEGACFAGVSGTSDEHEGHEAGEFPADEEEDEVIGGDQQHHGEREDDHEEEEAGVVEGHAVLVVAVEVAGGVGHDDGPNDKGEHGEEPAQRVEAKAYVNIPVGDPGDGGSDSVAAQQAWTQGSVDSAGEGEIDEGDNPAGIAAQEASQ